MVLSFSKMKNINNKVFVLIYTHHGLIQDPEFFMSYSEAKRRENQITKKSFSSDYDEIEIFEKDFSKPFCQKG